MEHDVGAAGRFGVLPGCQAGCCGCVGEVRQSVGALPYSGSVAGQQAAPANEPAQGAGAIYCTGTTVSRCWFVAFQLNISVAFRCTESPVARC